MHIATKMSRRIKKNIISGLIEYGEYEINGKFIMLGDSNSNSAILHIDATKLDAQKKEYTL